MGNEKQPVNRAVTNVISERHTAVATAGKTLASMQAMKNGHNMDPQTQKEIETYKANTALRNAGHGNPAPLDTARDDAPTPTTQNRTHT